MRRWRLVLVIVIGTCVIARGRAQERFDYTQLVRLYANGLGNDAVNGLLRSSRAEIDAASKPAGSTVSARLRVAAAMLHTEAAIALVDRKPFDAAFHVDTAGIFLQSAARDPVEHERATSIRRRWFYFVARVFVSAGQMQAASWYIRDGLLEFPRDGALYFARGTIAERTIQVGGQPDLRLELPDVGRERSRIEDLVKRAADDYQRALNLDHALALAHLHLGWGRLYLGDGRARSELEAAAADSATSRVRYLAHLFLGGLDERQKKLDDARREYEEALHIGPAYQTAYLALSRAEEAVGNTTRARNLALSCAQLAKTEQDPWWDFASGFDRDALTELRAEAPRQ